MQATADSLLFQSSPNFKENRYDFTRTSFEAGIHANLFWQPLWSPIGLKIQSNVVGLGNNWFERNSAFLQQYSAGVFYTSPSRWYMNLDWIWFKESNAVLPVKMDSKMSGVNFGIGYYWKWIT